MLARLCEKVILVTDGESALGERLIRRFIEEGAQVVVPAAGEESGENPLCLPCDQTDAVSVRALVDDVVERYGRLDVLLSNVQHVEPMTIEDATDAGLRGAIAENAAGAFFFTQAAARHMRKWRGGKILYLGSIHSEKPVGGAIGFSLSMAAVEMLCREVAVDLSGYQVQSVFVQLGGMENDEKRFESVLTPLYDFFEDKIPGSRTVAPEEIERLMVFLASDACTALNGAVLRADHGFLLNYMPRDTYERQGVDALD